MACFVEFNRAASYSNCALVNCRPKYDVVELVLYVIVSVRWVLERLNRSASSVTPTDGAVAIMHSKHHIWES